MDPIGLAGGLNAYGFANGDPVNYSDPFGLCTPMPECLLALAGGGAISVDALPGLASALPSSAAVASVGVPIAIGVIGAGLARPAFPGAGRLMTRTSPGAAAADATVVYSHSEDGESSVKNPDGSSKELGQQRDEIEKAQRGNRDKINRVNKSQQRGRKEDMEEAERALEELRNSRKQR